MSEWKEYRLGDLLKIKYGKDHKKLGDGEIPIYGSGGIMRTGDAYLSDKPSVLIPRKGTLSNIFYVEVPFWTVDTMFWSEINDNMVLPKYLYYAIKDYKWDSMNVGSAVPSLTVPVIESVSVSIPSLEIQKRIAAQLSEIDDKIAINRRICENLEAQAQALFKHWFIDFAPFKNGKFVESELGMIPEGWRVGKLESFFPIRTGKKDANIAISTGQYPFFSCSQNVLSTDVFSFDGSAILVAGNGDFNVKWYEGKFEAYQRTYVLMPYEPSYTHFLFYAIQYNLRKITCGAGGTVIKFIRKADLENFKIAIPKELNKCDVIHVFSEMNKNIANLHQENLRLSALRDTLLPKLMSGEIKV